MGTCRFSEQWEAQEEFTAESTEKMHGLFCRQFAMDDHSQQNRNLTTTKERNQLLHCFAAREGVMIHMGGEREGESEREGWRGRCGDGDTAVSSDSFFQ